MILGLDLSLTATGWAVVDRPGVHVTGLIPDTRGHIADRLGHWKLALRELLSCYRPDHIIIEDLPRSVRHGGPELGMIHATFWLTTNTLDATVTTIPPATLKQFATGRGNAGKDEMLVSAVRRLSYQGHDHNEADALWLAQLGARLHGYPNLIELPAGHLKALDKIKTKQEATTKPAQTTNPERQKHPQPTGRGCFASTGEHGGVPGRAAYEAPLRRLHGPQSTHRFDVEQEPPRENGTMWSISSSSVAPQ